jgi:hypothetical protein
MNPSLELSCRHPGDRYPFHGGLGLCVVNSLQIIQTKFSAGAVFKMKKAVKGIHP